MLLGIGRETDLERAVFGGEWLAKFLWNNACGIYRLDELETTLLDKISPCELQSSGLRRPELHIASELYGFGGHTRLLNSLMVEASDVLITRPGSDGHIIKVLGIDPSRIHTVKEGSAMERIGQVASVAGDYERIVLHIHPDDVVCALALRLLRRSRPNAQILFVNHSDHTFSVAIGVADFVLEISSFGWALRESRGTEQRSSFIGIPVDARAPSKKVRRVPGLLLSGASPHKFRPIAGASLPRAMRTVLQELPETRMIVIGPRKRDWWWWPLKLRFGRRVRTYTLATHANYLSSLQTCSVYIDSYPILGGTAFTEALLHGCNVAGLVGLGLGYGAADSLRSGSATQLADHIRGLLAQELSLISRQETIRARARRFHCPRAVRDRLDATGNNGALNQPPPDFANVAFHRSFEDSWSKSIRLIVPGFRNRRNLHVVPELAIKMISQFGSTSAALTVLLKACVAAFRTR
jgi:hypothetical protein